MRRVRTLIEAVEGKVDELGARLSEASLTLRADPRGQIYLESDGVMTVPPHWDQSVMSEVVVDLLARFQVEDDLAGPDLRAPRELLRIIPGKLSGEPHIVDTRIETRVLAALGARDMRAEQILELYPGLTEQGLTESLDLERQLERNLAAAA